MDQGFAECLAVLEEDFTPLRMAPGDAKVSNEVQENEWIDPGFVGFTLEKGLTTRLYGIYSKQSSVAMALKTKAIAKIPLPMTPRR